MKKTNKNYTIEKYATRAFHTLSAARGPNALLPSPTIIRIVPANTHVRLNGPDPVLLAVTGGR